MSKKPVNRRAFIAGTAAAGAAMSLPAASYARIKAANEKLKVGFLGTGGRCQQHIDVIVDMRDEGKGVSDDVRGRLFEPFSRSAEKAAGSSPGVGLGLSLSRSLARAMGGDLRLEPGAGGACFLLTLKEG